MRWFANCEANLSDNLCHYSFEWTFLPEEGTAAAQ